MNAGNSGKKIFKTLFSVSGIVILGKLLGFMKQAVSAGYFGATVHTDIISISEGVVTDIDYLLVQTLITAFIPVYIDIKQKDEKESKKFVSDTLLLFFVISMTLCLLIELLAPMISRVIVPSYSLEMSGQLTVYIRIFASALIMIVLLAVFNALLKANSHFVQGESVSIVQSLTTIILIILIGHQVGPDTIVIAFFAYSLINFVYLGGYSKRYWRLEKSNPFTNKNVKVLLKMMLPMTFGYAMLYINQQVDKIIVSGLGNGTITSMHYAATLSNFVTAFVGSTCSVIFTHIANNVSSGNNKEAATLVNKFGIIYTTVLLPIFILAVLNAEDIVTIVYARGAFDQVAVDNSTRALMGYVCMFVPLVFRELFSRMQYAYQESIRPMINSSIGIIVNIGLSILFSRMWGVLGVTFATSFSVLISALLNIVSAKKLNQYLLFSSYTNYLPFWTFGGIACVAMTKIGISLLHNIKPWIRFITISMVSLILYGLIMMPIMVRFIKNFRNNKTGGI